MTKYKVGDRLICVHSLAFHKIGDIYTIQVVYGYAPICYMAQNHNGMVFLDENLWSAIFGLQDEVKFEPLVYNELFQEDS